MSEQAQTPETLQEAILYYADPLNCLGAMIRLRWPEGVTCPHCQSERVRYMEKVKKWLCNGCRKQFSAKAGTIFEDSPLGLDKWFAAIWMVTNAKNGISSAEIGRALGVTQKTGWFVLQRIRLAMRQGSLEKLSGEVEVDETFIGGKAKNMHLKERKRRITGTGTVDKVIVMGLLARKTEARPSKVQTKIVQNRQRVTVHPAVQEHVEAGSELYTDAFVAYHGLDGEYVHAAVDHAERYVEGKVHTNGLENFWSLLKRTIGGTYIAVDPDHLMRYLDEQALRFNERHDNDAGRFATALGGIVGKRLTYQQLTAREEGAPPRRGG